MTPGPGLRTELRTVGALLLFLALTFGLGSRLFVEGAFFGNEGTRMDRQANAVLAFAGLADDAPADRADADGLDCMESAPGDDALNLSPYLAAQAILALETYNRGAAWRKTELLLAGASRSVLGTIPDWSYGPFQIRLSTARRALSASVPAQEAPSDADVFDYLRDACLHNRIAVGVIREIIRRCGAQERPERLIACVANYYRGGEGQEAASIYAESFRLIYQKLSHKSLGGTLPLLTGRVHASLIQFPPGSARLDPTQYAFDELDEHHAARMDRITLQGLHDGVGESAFRTSLAGERAGAVEAALLPRYPGVTIVRRGIRGPTPAELRAGAGVVVTLYRTVAMTAPRESDLFHPGAAYPEAPPLLHQISPRASNPPPAPSAQASAAAAPGGGAAHDGDGDGAHDDDGEEAAAAPSAEPEIVVVPEPVSPLDARGDDPLAFCRPEMLRPIIESFGACALPPAGVGGDAGALVARAMQAFEQGAYDDAAADFGAAAALVPSPRTLRYLGWSRTLGSGADGGGCLARSIEAGCGVADPAARTSELAYGFDNLGRWALRAGMREEAAGLHALEAYERFHGFDPDRFAPADQLREWRKGSEALHDAAWLLRDTHCASADAPAKEACREADAMARWAADDWAALLEKIDGDGALDDRERQGPASFAIEAFGWRYARDPVLRALTLDETVELARSLLARATAIWRERNPRYLRTLAAVECLAGDLAQSRRLLLELPRIDRFEADRALIEGCQRAAAAGSPALAAPIVDLGGGAEER